MPTVQSDGCPINFEVEGPQNAPVLILSNSIATNLHMWDDQAPMFSKQFRWCATTAAATASPARRRAPIRWRCSAATCSRSLDAVGLKKFNWCGLSMGGMVGQWLGANAPDRIDKLDPLQHQFLLRRKEPWNDRIKLVHRERHRALVDPMMERWFTKGFRERAPQKIARMRAMFLATVRRAMSAAAMPSATWISPRPTRASPCRRWSSSASRMPRRLPPAKRSPSRSRAPSSPRSMPRTSPMSSSRRSTPTRCSNFLSS